MTKENPKQYIIKECTVKNLSGKNKMAAVLFENQKALPLIEIEATIRNKYIGYLQIFQDLEFIKECLIYLNNNFEKEDINFLKESVWISLIINYAKCFVHAQGRKIKLEPNVIFKNKDLLEIHNEIMDLRHQYIAHSGINSYEIPDVYLALDITNENIIKGFYFSFKKAFTSGKDKIKNYSILVEHVWQFVDNKIKTIDDKYREQLLKTNTIEEIIKKAYYFDEN